jgi:hypothetical protein
MAKKGEEKTIKVSADVEDLKKAFEQVEKSYAEVAQASKEYAAALESSSKAVTDEEKKVAKEVEKTTKTILTDTKKRAAAYRDQATALKTQGDALKQKIALTDKDTDASAKNVKTMGASTAALAGLGVAALAAASKIGDLVRKYAEVDAASGRLANSFKSAGASTEDMARAESIATEMSKRGQASRLESIDSIRLLTDASGNATQAIDDYRLAVDIASQTGKTAAEASDLLSKVRKGEVEELKSMRGLNKELAEDLGKIEDATIKTEIAMQLLSESYDGAAHANAGLIDRQKAFSLTLEEAELAAGNLFGAIGESGTGLVGSFGKLIGVFEDGSDPVRTLTGAFSNFGDAIRDTTRPIQDLVEAGGALGALFSGRGLFAVIDEAETKRAKSVATSNAAADAVKKETAAVKEQADAKTKLAKELAEQEKKKASDAAKAAKAAEAEAAKQKREDDAKRARNKAAASEAAALKKQLAEEDEESDRENAAILAAAEELAGVENLAAARLESDRIHEESMLRQTQMMEERHLRQQMALDLSEEERAALAIQIELEKELFAIRSSGMEPEAMARAENIALLKTEGKTLAGIAKKDEETANKKKAIYDATVDATASVGAAALEAAGLSNAATALESGIKAAYYTGESFAAFAGANIPSGIGFAAAAAQHAIVAGGALAGGLGGGGGGGSKPSSSSGSDRLQRSSPVVTNAAAASGATVVNVNTLSYVSPEDARRIGHAEAREARATIGGRPK